jgi:hypothetical protein
MPAFFGMQPALCISERDINHRFTDEPVGSRQYAIAAFMEQVLIYRFRFAPD